MIAGSDIYYGTADALRQNIDIFIDDGTPERVTILSGDHIYAMDLRQMQKFHDRVKARFTICAIPVRIEEAAGQFGVLEIDSEWRVIGFEEKPAHPKEIPGMPGYCLASMGNYVADFVFLTEVLSENNGHDFGLDIIPAIIPTKKVYAYNYLKNKFPGKDRSYWRDVGTIEAFHAANIDLAQIDPMLNLYNPEWPIYTPADHLAPAKINSTLQGSMQYILSGGCILQGCFIKLSVLGRNVRIWDGARVENTVIFDDVTIGSGCDIYNTIVDGCVDIPPGTIIGRNWDDDFARGFYDPRDTNCRIPIVPYKYKFQ